MGTMGLGPTTPTNRPQPTKDLTIMIQLFSFTSQVQTYIPKDVFNGRDIEHIFHIPLSSRSHKDVWYWKVERKGSYIVGSGYRALQPEMHDEREEI